MNTMRNIKNYFLKSALSICCLLSVICCLWSVVSLAEDIAFDTSVNGSQVSLGSALELNLNFTGTANISNPQLPEIDGFNWRYIGPSSSVSIINGKTSSSITHMYQLLPLKTGTITIPSFSVTYKGKTYSSKPITVEVVKGALNPGQNSSQDKSVSSADIKDSIFLRLAAGKKTAYINEIIPVSVKLYMRELSVSDVQYPRIAQEGFLIEPFGQYKKYRETMDGVSYDVIEFYTSAFALRPGVLNMGPAKAQCNLLLQKRPARAYSPFDDMHNFFGGRNSLFDRYERYPLDVASDLESILIKELPSEGRPKGFNQSLGEYTFHLQAEPKEVNVGDPITLRMIVSGKGNFKTVNPPVLDFSDDFKIYEPQVQNAERSKMFEQVIIPKSEAVSEIPAISFSFFNPLKQDYETITKPPIAIKVTKLNNTDKPTIEDYSSMLSQNQDEALKRDIVFIKDKIGRLRKKNSFLYGNPMFLVLQIMPLIVLGIVFLAKKKAERIRTDTRYARRLLAPAKAKKGIKEAFALLEAKETEKFFDSVHKTISHYFSYKLHLPIGGVTIEALVEAFKGKGISEPLQEKIREVFAICDMARFAPLEFTDRDMEAVFKKMQEVIDYIERKKL
jgi:oxygen tolerance protein BatD